MTPLVALLLPIALLLAPPASSASASASASPPRGASSSSSSSRPPERALAASPSSGRRASREKEERYEILPSDAILERMRDLVANHPDYVTLTTTQEWFGLPRAGGEDDCPFDATYEGESGPGCNNYVLIVQDKQAYPDDSDVRLDANAEQYLAREGGWFGEGEEGGSTGAGRSGWTRVPDVFLSGSVHGNERVGPTSLLEMAELLVAAAHCEGLPRSALRPSNGATAASNETAAAGDDHVEMEVVGDSAWEDEVAAARSCRSHLSENLGLPPAHRRWLARLVSTRRTVIIPTANALGYSRDKREEGHIDPNRDFPFDIPPSKDDTCMQTIAGRSINELFRSHLFPIGLTFHGGMEVIGYEWGAPTYLSNEAPDARAQDAIAGAYSRYAGGFEGHQAYDYGTMNDKVYYVRGGMEDWAFAGSWDPDRVVSCNPDTFGGYPRNKTVYNNATLRAFNMLVETSDPKAPGRGELGKRTGKPLHAGGGGENGHIARNIRLALLAMDVVEPYLSIRSAGGLVLEEDIVPGVNPRRHNGNSYFENSMMVWVPGMGIGRRKMKESGVTITWTVAGAFEIDETELVYGPWEALPAGNLADAVDGAYPSAQTLQVIADPDSFQLIRPSLSAGRSRWHEKGAQPSSGTSEDGFDDAVFQATVDPSRYPPGTTLAVFARARVDKSWLDPVSPNDVAPRGLGPVSHVVNARRNPDYLAMNEGKEIRGREDNWWYSAPITLVAGSDAGVDGEEYVLREARANSAPILMSADGNQVLAVHVNSRMGYLPEATETLSHPSKRGGVPISQSIPWLLGSLVVFFSIALLVVHRRRRARYGARSRLDDLNLEDEDVAGGSFGPPYRDDPASGAIEIT
ncbi:hypothetical protein ACHAWF_014767 [Thalassiosira exigua]